MLMFDFIFFFACRYIQYLLLFIVLLHSMIVKRLQMN